MATFFATLLLGGAVVAAVLGAPVALRSRARELLGSVVVSDRRIAWVSPRHGHLYRTIEGADLLGVALVEARGGRGWITVSECRRGSVREIDLIGWPEPELALSAIRQTIARQTASR